MIDYLVGREDFDACLDSRLAYLVAVVVIGLLPLDRCQSEELNPSDETPALLLDDFDGGVQNCRNGFRNAFFRRPSLSKAHRVDGGFGGSKRSLRIAVQKTAQGFSGAWVQFFNLREREPKYLDASRWSFLSFQVKGRHGGEFFNVRLADQRWSRKEDALLVGSIDDFLPNGVSTNWQEVVVPFSAARSLNFKELASLSIELPVEGEHEIFIDHICLKSKIDQPVPAVRLTLSTNQSLKSLPRCMWVWSTLKVIQDERKTNELLSCCQRENISVLWMQLPYSLDRQIGKKVKCEIKSRNKMRDFIQKAHQVGVAVHALDGYPEFALRAHHSTPLAVLNAVIEFNKMNGADQASSSASISGRFDGVHFDNEPYLLLGWHNDRQREKILTEFLELNAVCQALARKAGLEFGVDIPFWWNRAPERSAKNRAIGSVVFRGVRKPASEHCIDMLDNVGIMNYRDRADGADGLISHGQDLLKYADRTDRAKIYMGIETFRYAPTRIRFVVGLTQDRFERALIERGCEIAQLSRIDGLKFFHLKAAGRVHVGIEDRGVGKQSTTAANAIRKLALYFGHWSDGVEDWKLLNDVEKAIRNNSEWQDFSAETIELPEQQMAFPGFVATRIMPSKVTFADNPVAEIRAEIRFAEEDFLQYKSYSGFAIHSWESFSKKRIHLQSVVP